MEYNYINQLMNIYPRSCGYSYSAVNILPDENIYRNVEGITNKVGYLNVYVISGKEQTPVPNAFVTISVRKGENIEVPIMNITTSLNPILVQIPVAFDKNTVIEGPEYSFSTYNLKVNATGYYSTRILNIRMFPGIVTDFNISMIPTTESNIEGNGEQIINIPPHPRDRIK